ncbi:Flp pilus assembly protein CpaB [Thalassoroseus pseudoceratinae]|uniref:Flp pilus assembly protein CpaB n=1 Tax=Thalassoroseus pseudoceratinae TaxID=2713176 RepID=UPI001423A4A4|nr:Flp pilus assembly protein CpaB [Thalassoroseus pseudoceratinae]
MKKLTPALVTLLMLGVVGLLIGVYIFKKLTAGDDVAEAPRTRNVPMAIADIESGTLITEAHLGQGPVLTDEMERDTLLNNRVIVGRVAKTEIKRATAIRSGNLFPPNEGPALEVADGMRAVTVVVGPNDDLVDGLVRVGTYVDMLFSPDNTNDPRMQGGTTLTLLKGIKVLALNRTMRSTNRVDRGGNTATLEVTPQQAIILTEVQRGGNITLALNPDGRNGTGVSVSSDDRASLEEILDLEPIPEPTPPFATEIFKGGARDVLRFREGERTDVNPVDPRDTQPMPQDTPLTVKNEQPETKPAEKPVSQTVALQRFVRSR